MPLIIYSNGSLLLLGIAHADSELATKASTTAMGTKVVFFIRGILRFAIAAIQAYIREIEIELGF